MNGTSPALERLATSASHNGAARDPSFAAGRRERWRAVASLVILGLVYAILLGAGYLALARYVPDHLVRSVAGRTIDIENVHGRVLKSVLTLLVIVPIAFAVECAFVGWRGSSLRQYIVDPSPSMKMDLSIFALGQLRIFGLLGRVMVFGLTVITGEWIHNQLWGLFGLPEQIDAPFVIQFVVFFYLYTFLDYWTHRFGHTKYFWPIHRFHHSAEDLCMLTHFRQHPGDIMSIFVMNLPLGVLGAPPTVMIAINLAILAFGLLTHSRLDSNWGWVGRWVIQSPNHHRDHHAVRRTPLTGNYSIAPIWDRLFGTWGEESDPSRRVGVATRYRHGFWIAPDLFRDYWHFWRAVLKRVSGGRFPPSPRRRAAG